MRRSVLACCALLLAAASCGSEPTPAGPAVLVIQDGSVPDAREVVSPAVLAAEAALQERGLRAVIADTGGLGGETLRIAREGADDPAIVGVIVAPFTWLPVEARDELLAAGLGVVSLSSTAPGIARGAAWRRLVPDVEDEAVALLQTTTGAIPCVAGEGTAASRALTSAVQAAGGPNVRSLGGPPAVAAALAGPEGCTGVIWTGSAPGAIAFRDGLAVPIPIALGAAARTAVYLETGWPAGEGTVGICGCADLTTSAGPDAQEIVHAYQSSTGLDPGPFAVEGADAVALLIGSGETVSRDGVRARLAATTEWDGAVTRYAWNAGGEPDPPPLRIYEARGVRWLPS
ncbi:MAG TPA: hypothetical protein VF235_03425 [Actinomycetota bacterium]